jgi:hypothetical protein
MVRSLLISAIALTIIGLLIARHRAVSANTLLKQIQQTNQMEKHRSEEINRLIEANHGRQ